MKLSIQSCIKVLAVLFLSLSYVACSDSDDPVPVVPDEIILKSDDKIEFAYGATTESTFEFNSNTGWELSPSETAWVEITPKSGAAGDVKLSVKLKEEATEVDREVKVTIVAGTASDSFMIYQFAPKKAESIKIITLQNKIKLNRPLQLKLEVLPKGAPPLEKANWSTSDDAVITVDENGIITGVELGIATITATTEGLSDQLEFEVTELFTTDGTGKTYTLKMLSEIESADLTIEGSAYIVNEPIIIAEYDIIKLQDEEVVKFHQKTYFMIKGMADFTPTKRALLTNYDVDVIESRIYFTGDNQGGGEIDNVEFNISIRSHGVVPLTINNCLFTNISSKESAIVLGNTTAKTTVTNCEFIENGSSAISAGANIPAPAHFANNFLRNNSKESRNRPQINLTVAGDNLVEILNNTIEGPKENTTVGGISIANLLGIGGANKVIISGNDVRYCRYGITTNGVMDVLIENNKLIDNKYEANANNGGSGISIYNGAGGQKASIKGNEITDNLWGITVIGNAAKGTGPTVNLGKVGDANPGGNIFKNNENNGTLFDLYNNSPIDMWAQGNTWNVATQTEALIETVIVHKVDDAALGTVTFMPAAN